MTSKKIFTALALTAAILAGCSSEADIASKNLSKAADQFEVDRRIIFYNGITDSYMLTIEGKCSLGNQDNSGKLSVTCRVGEQKYKKHFLGLSDNVTYFVEHLEPTSASGFRHRVILRPDQIVPAIEVDKE